ncbi:MAG: hypothetical protein ACRDQB_10970 [Thermocrispum sp.]
MNVRIERRFHGPEHSGNGGYTCGVAAQAVAGPAEVRLLRPPPLERPLELRTTADGVELLDGEVLVARARRAEPSGELPSAISYDEAVRAAEEFDSTAYEKQHPFPGCFTCGPARHDGDGLRLFPGRTARERVIAWPWTPDESVRGPRSAVDPLFVWAALDCPSGLSWYHDTTHRAGPHVLGQLTTRLERLPEIGEPTVVAGWLTSADGRKRYAGSAIWSADGELLAHADATWVRLTEEQWEQFRRGPVTAGA